MAVPLSNFDVLTLICLPKLDPHVSARFLTTRLGSRAPWGNRFVAACLRTPRWFHLLVNLLMALQGVFVVLLVAISSDSSGASALVFVVSFVIVAGAWSLMTSPVSLVRAQRIRIRKAQRGRVDPALVHAEMFWRCEAWLPYLKSNKGKRLFAEFVQKRNSKSWTRLAYLAFIPLPVLLNMLRALTLNVFLAYMLCFIGLIILDRQRNRNEIKALIASLEEERCSACGYSLKERRSLCPARCPECGVRWPLLPPPLFDPPDSKLVTNLPQIKRSEYA
jgi:hypothetical protein